MKRFIPLLSSLLLSIVLVGTVHAEKADADKQTDIVADQMAYDDVKQINTFTGNVILTRGSLLMKAGKVIVTQDPAGYQYATLYAAPGALATFRQKRDGGPDLWMEGQAERIEYDGKLEIVKLFGKAMMRRLEGNKPTDEVEGEFISYDSQAEFLSVNNTVTGASKPGAGRVKAVIQPRTDSKAK
ncbi:MAG TPA: lipopolysaccharide transport periplasmic protein LptA [Oxalobacteraceae bacterium]|jgi:lipopolysaccharide export system protein LptA|nr:lipopolysaccharide transport periplasmic protein LptA [Oxalobacteraceae bacterium]